MAKKSKGSTKREKGRDRKERRFEPAALTSAFNVYLVGGIGALLMGAGAWGQFGALLQDKAPEPFKYAAYVLAAGALLVGVAIWIGTSGDASLRVGDAGIAVDRGNLRRMPWHAVERVEWAASRETVRVTGRDDLGTEMIVSAALKSHPQAAAWIVKEARERVPGLVDVPDDATLPDPLASAGTTLPLEPPQVVGKHCAASGKVIAYEPDARVCVRCERVYHRTQVPETCECGASLVDLRQPAQSA
jgi:hypothetical protein